MNRFLFFVAAIQLASVSAQDIGLSQYPEPYANLQEVLPYDGHNWFGMSNQRALTALIHKKQLHTIVEIGTWLGKSAITMASLLPEDGRVYAVDTWKGGVEKAYEIHAKRLAIAYEQFLSNVIHMGMTQKVVPLRMASLDGAKYLEGKVSPDLVYVDASHEEADVYDDLCAWWPYVQEGGILCGDDWLWSGVALAVKQFAKENDLRVLVVGNFWCYTRKPGPLVSDFDADSVISGRGE